MLVKKIKQFVKRWLAVFLTIPEQDMQNMLEKTYVVSFDIFDTLVKRNVRQPEDIHKIVGTQFYEQTGIEIRDYQKMRCRAERNARRECDEEEICLQDIFDHIKDIPAEQKAILQQLEKRIEIENVMPHRGMQQIYKKIVDYHKRIIITSDMYLDKAVIEKILEKCGYTEYEKIYLSSVEGVMKRTGNLFRIILKEQKINADEMLHIGDNPISDYLAPRMLGIKTFLVKKD